MPYNEQLAERIRNALAHRPEVTEKKMFGGLSFILRGHMACDVINDDLVVRLGPEAHENALAQPHARPMDFTGRAMKGFVYVGPQGCQQDSDFTDWVNRGLDFADSLPPKRPK